MRYRIRQCLCQWPSRTLEERAADLSLGLGLVGAVGSAITGAAQWQDTTNEEAPRRLGALHALLNVAATTLMAGSWVLRKQGQRRTGLALSTAGLGINLASAWLGGELAYDLGIGVDHAAFEKPPTKWTTVAVLDDLLDGKPHRVDADGTPILLLREGDQIRAVGATCPHLGGPLDEGTIDSGTVTCPWHGSVFSLADGALIHGPAMMPIAAYEGGLRTATSRSGPMPREPAVRSGTLSLSSPSQLSAKRP
jgi:nitrite reductase/ring-hydroxylating ferredoxin subunit